LPEESTRKSGGRSVVVMVNKLCTIAVWANAYGKFNPTSPSGGYKESGFGREGGLQGLAAYCRLDLLKQLRHKLGQVAAADWPAMVAFGEMPLGLQILSLEQREECLIALEQKVLFATSEGFRKMVVTVPPAVRNVPPAAAKLLALLQKPSLSAAVCRGTEPAKVGFRIINQPFAMWQQHPPAWLR
jgi:hypothetical protein